MGGRDGCRRSHRLFHMPCLVRGSLYSLSKSMQGIPTKFSGNPVKTKSELLYLHYQVFREWGKARCSGKHKGRRSIKQGRKKGDCSPWLTGSFVWGSWQCQGLPCEEEPTDSQYTDTRALLRPPGFSNRRCWLWDTVIMGAAISLSDCFAAMLWTVLLNHLDSQHSCSALTCVCICMCSQSSMHRACDIPYMVQRSQPYSH